jgi:hypothetical protein
MHTITNDTIENCISYATGYYDGRATGVSNVPTRWEGELAGRLYRLGYDRGVADFCAEELDGQEE